MSKIIIYRNGTWYSGLCLDQITIQMGKKVNNIYEELNQFKYSLQEKLGYEVEDRYNNPFDKTEQFEYYNEYNDKVVVRVNWENKTQLHILKQYNDIENCETTVEVITRLGALNKLFDDIVELFRKEYGVENDE